MHPLQVFGRLLDFVLLAPFLIRIAASLFVLYLGRKRYKKQYSWLSIIYFLGGAFVFVGLYTQIAVLVAVLALVIEFYLEYWRNKGTAPISTETYFLYTLAIVVLLSLMVTGPGAFAFDLPL